MDRGAWWATAHGVTELDMTEVTEHARTPEPARWDSVNSCVTFRNSGPQFLPVSKGRQCTHPRGWGKG